MSGRDWQPGDVVIATVRGVPNVRIMRRKIDRLNSDWAFASTEGVTFSCTSAESEIVDARPLIVIDPDNREQVEQLLGAFHLATGAHVASLEEARFALLRMIPPPKPEEPTGLGAVVEDTSGKPYVRISSGFVKYPWRDEEDSAYRWHEIDAAKVVTKGVAA